LKVQINFQATKDHYGCPGPVSFNGYGQRQDGGASWDYDYIKFISCFSQLLSTCHSRSSTIFFKY
jgi:hypothetical protein